MAEFMIERTCNLLLSNEELLLVKNALSCYPASGNNVTSEIRGLIDDLIDTIQEANELMLG